jgi:hypothetical protein
VDFLMGTFIKKKNMVDLKEKELPQRESFKESPASIVVNSFKHEVDS